MNSTPPTSGSERLTRQDRLRRPLLVALSWAKWRYASALAASVWVLCSTVGAVPDWAWSEQSAALHSRVARACNCDVAIIYDGIRKVPTLAGTVRWWHGTWVGQVPFWRPLTSLAFWVEYHAFGPDRLDGWIWVSAAMHLGATVLAALLAARLTGNWWAGPVVAVLFGTLLLGFPVLRARGPGAEPVHLILTVPNAQQELWMAIPALGAMLATLSRRWVWALLLCALSVCAKEMGWTAFPLCLLVLWMAQGCDGLRRIPLWAWGLGTALVGVLLLARWSAGPEVFRGFHQGTNESWPVRLMSTVGGCFVQAVDAPTWAPALWVTIAFIGWLLWGRRGGGGRLAAAVVVGLAAATWTQMVSWSVPWDVALTQLLMMPKQIGDAAFGFVSLCVLWAYLQKPSGRDLRPVLLAVFATTAPYVAVAQALSSGLYLQRVFVAILVFVCAVALEECLCRRYAPTAAEGVPDP